jgi:hypothetical protein
MMTMTTMMMVTMTDRPIVKEFSYGK